MSLGWSIPTTPAAPVERPRRTCQICGRPGLLVSAEEHARIAQHHAPPVPDAVSVTMVRWHDPLPGHEFGEAVRCEDHEACWTLVTDFGEDWPVNDGRPRRRPRERPRPGPAHGEPAPLEQAEITPVPRDVAGRSRAMEPDPEPPEAPGPAAAEAIAAPAEPAAEADVIDDLPLLDFGAPA